MPPVGAPRPDRAMYDAVLASIDQSWSASAKAPETGTSVEIAERLAALLWSSVPDATLLQVAQQNRLSEPGVLERLLHVHDDEGGFSHALKLSAGLTYSHMGI